MTSVSRTTIIVAAAGPNKRTAAKTKVSETESLAATPGIRTVKEPLRSVSTASITHCHGTGCWLSVFKD
jgi:hypothetical protein